MKTIYCLVCPITNRVRYIGATNQTFKERLSGHLSDINSRKKTAWLSMLKKKKKIPLILEIDIVPSSESLYWEIFYIQTFKSWGFDLVNVSYNHTKNTSLQIIKSEDQQRNESRIHAKKLRREENNRLQLVVIKNRLFKEKADF